jgi:cell division protease FtsH
VNVFVPESELPVDLTPFQAVEAAYPTELQAVTDAVTRGLASLVECDKELVPYFYRSIRDRLKKSDLTCLYLDGRVEKAEAGSPQGLVATILNQLRDAVRGNVELKVVVLPHLDLLVNSAGGLTTEARESIALLYENPNLLWIGFKDPSFALPKVIENLFPHHERILGIARERVRHVVTQREARKFGREFNPFALYKHISGLNVIRIRRLLTSLEGEDYPTDPRRAVAQLRQATLSGELSVPDIDLHKDIGGYALVKKRIQEEILDIIAYKDTLTDPDEVARVEKLIPKGLIFLGPPGTGKTLFAKAMATALGAAVQIVSGPELKSKWVGESEENIRRIFVRARQSAPSIIVFDEIDSIAPARGTYMGSGVEHSMVNQLLTELDGFRSNEMVFVVGTTNFVESLDPALLRPGRFEFRLEIPWPDARDRREILGIYDRKLGLEMTDEAVEHAVRRSRGAPEGGTGRYSGDHLQALGRAIARNRIRDRQAGPTGPLDVERALEGYATRPSLTPSEERVIATHECGHAIAALYCAHLPPIERISIRGDIGGALGYVQHSDPANRYVLTRNALLDRVCVLFGGREAEDLFLDDLSIGSQQDLEQATQIARALVESLGMGSAGVGVRQYSTGDARQDPQLPESKLQEIDKAVLEILEGQRQRCRSLIEAHRGELVALRDTLLERKVLDRSALTAVVADPHPREPAS